jgi:cytochrome oxidase assembly protein ShyY1
MNINVSRCTIQCNLWWLIVSILAMYLFHSLGMWQLQRYEAKKNWLDQQSEIELKGVLLNNFTLYIDNKIMHQKPGYEVFQAFQLIKKNHLSTEVALISRGWIEQPKNAQQHHDRSYLPQISLSSQEPIQIKTQKIAFIPTKYGITHFEINKKNTELTIRASRLDLVEVQKILNKQANQLKLIASYYLTLPKNSAYQLTPLPETSTWLHPHKHLGYALQWFAFELITLFLFIRFGLCFEVKTPEQKSSKLKTGKLD